MGAWGAWKVFFLSSTGLAMGGMFCLPKQNEIRKRARCLMCLSITRPASCVSGWGGGGHPRGPASCPVFPGPQQLCGMDGWIDGGFIFTPSFVLHSLLPLCTTSYVFTFPPSFSVQLVFVHRPYFWASDCSSGLSGGGLEPRKGAVGS